MTDDDEDRAYERSAEILRNRDERQVRLSLNGWTTTNLSDLQQFRDQCAAEAETYAKRERPTVARTFKGLADMANFELEGRVVGGEQPSVWHPRRHPKHLGTRHGGDDGEPRAPQEPWAVAVGGPPSPPD